MILVRLFLLIFVMYGHFHATSAVPCKAEDNECMKKFISDLEKSTFENNYDPFFIDEVNVSLSDIEITFQNATAVGLRKCVVNNVRSSKGSLDYEFVCPSFTMVSKYVGNGRISILPVHGNGDAKFTTGKIIFRLESKHKKQQKSDGENRFQFKIFKFKADVVEPLQFELTNLFDGQKELSDAFLKFAHENWKLLADLFIEPIMQPFFDILVKSKNKYLASAFKYEDIIKE